MPDAHAPVDFASAVALGGKFLADTVVAMQLTFADGRTMRADLPVIKPPMSESETADAECAEDIIDVLRTLRPGEWMSRRALAAAVGQSVKSGTLQRALNRQKFGDSNILGKVEVHRRRGCRLKIGT